MGGERVKVGVEELGDGWWRCWLEGGLGIEVVMRDREEAEEMVEGLAREWEVLGERRDG